MKQLKKLETMWIEYRDACYPLCKIQLHPIQEKETHQAFYAGCLVAIKAITESANELPEEEALKAVEELLKETLDVLRPEFPEFQQETE